MPAAVTSDLARSRHGLKLNLERGTPLMQPNSPDTIQGPEEASSPHVSREAVGIISTSGTALQQVAYLLARDGVGVSKAMQAGLDRELQKEDKTMGEALEDLQCDPATVVITLIAQSPPPDSAQMILRQVRSSDKPTVVCFLGSDPRLVWRAGAIPASRLDEAAMRAAAWVRGWDQALVSSRLEEQKERLLAWAGDLRGRIGSGRRGLCGLFSSQALYDESQLTLSQNQNRDTANTSPLLSLILVESESQKPFHLQRALSDPDLAVVLVDTVLSAPSESESTGILAAVEKPPLAPLVITHVCGSARDLKPATAKEALLRDTGIVVAPSNAAAAYLAKSLIGELP